MFDLLLLEQRRLLSVSATFDSATRLIDVVGTDKPDRIDVRVEYALVKRTEPTLDDPGEAGSVLPYPVAGPVQSKRVNDAVESAVITVTANGLPLRRWTLPLGVVAGVHLTGAGGDDVLSLENYATPLQADVDAGDGHDVIVVGNAAGAPGSVVYGGAGDDLINLVSAVNATAGHTAYGDAGDDLIFGSANDDFIWGDDDGIREVYVPQGNDVVFAGAGNDHVWGGGGDDSLHGDDGDDWLCGDAGFDYVDGDDGNDTGVFDNEDKFERIEQLVVPA
jgi:hypothetical protein